MEPTLQPNMAVSVPGQISGDRIIDDILRRVEDRLIRCGDLRIVDSYRAYSCQIVLRLQLLDIDDTQVDAEISVGTIDPEEPVQRIEIGADETAQEADSPELERPIDGAQAPTPRRMHISRIRGRQ